MKILVVQETDWVERNPILHHRMIEALSREGHQVTVVDFEILWSSRAGRPPWQPRQVIDNCHKFFDDAQIRVIRSPMLRVPGLGRLSWLVFNSIELRNLIRDQRPDVIVAYSISNAYVALKLARRHGIPFVYHVMDALHTLAEPPQLRAPARLIERSVMRGADRVIVINNRLKDYAVTMGARSSNVQVVPIGTNHAPIPEGLRERVRASLNLAEGDTVLLFVGWLYEFSGVREIVAEIARRREEAQHLKLLVVGDGDLFTELQQMRDRLDLHRNLILTGRRPREEIQGYIAASDFGLLPAQRNSTMEHIVPSKVPEYMEAGRAVIATRLPGLEAEFGGVRGLLYSDSAEDAISIALAEAPNARALGESCAQFMATRPSWDDVTSAFRSVLEGPPPHAVSAFAQATYSARPDASSTRGS